MSHGIQYVSILPAINPTTISNPNNDQSLRNQFNPTSVVFSPIHQSLFLAGGPNQIGHFLLPELKNISVWRSGFQEPVKQLWRSNHNTSNPDPLIFSIGSNGVKGWSTSGRVLFSCKTDEFENCLSCSIDDNCETVFLGNKNGKVWLWDIQKSKFINKIIDPIEENISIIKMQLTKDFLVCAMNNGSIQLRDKKSLEIIHNYPRHSGPVTDIAVKDSLVVSCGQTMRGNTLECDRQLQMLDIKMMKLQPGISFMNNPLFLRFHPIYPSRLLVVGSNGHYQWKELPRDSAGFQMQNIFSNDYQPYPLNDNPHIISFDISGSGDSISFVDSFNRVHVFGTSLNPQIPNPNAFKQKFTPIKEFEHDYTHASIYMDDETSLNVVSTYDEDNFSRNGILSNTDMKAELQFKAPRQINKVLLSKAVKKDKFSTPLSKVSSQIKVTENPGLLSIQEGYAVKRRGNRNNGDDQYCDADECLIPKQYRFISSEVKGPNSFDFKKHNRTQFTGLENSFEKGSLFNSFIQILYHLNRSLRQSIINHTCDVSECITCQLGHLFKMMEKKQVEPNKTCFPGNFMRILNRKLSKQDKNNEGKLFDDKNHNTTPNVIHILITAISEDLQKDETYLIPNKYPYLLSTSKESSLKRNLRPQIEKKNLLEHYMSSLLGIKHQCTHCSKEGYHESKRMFYRISLPSQTCTFEQAIQNSICNVRNETIKRKCKNCEKYSCFRNISKCITLPNIFCFVFSDRGMDQLWLHQQYITKNSNEDQKEECIPVHKVFKEEKFSIAPRLIVSRVDDSWKIQAIYHDDQIEDDFYDSKNPQSLRVVYELKSFMIKVHHPLSEGKGHHISFIKSEDYPHSWYLFNDFTISKQENMIYDFTTSWKQANILFYVRKEVTKIDISVQKKEPILSTNLLKDCDPIPKKGDIVAIDAEFVKLKSFNVLSLGRVSVVREDGTILLDDYVRLGDTEEVEDYLTQFSGLREGDLDSSNKKALDLDIVYRRLQYLVDIGVVFVGHGLKNDFKIINLVVPSEQIRDTAEIFQLQNQRLIRLRFLSQILLKIDVQKEEHDSVEDALTALNLYKISLTLQENNQLNTAIDNIYKIGRQLNWATDNLQTNGIISDLNQEIESPKVNITTEP